VSQHEFADITLIPDDCKVPNMHENNGKLIRFSRLFPRVIVHEAYFQKANINDPNETFTCAWNNAIGFEQLFETDLEEFYGQYETLQDMLVSEIAVDVIFIDIDEELVDLSQLILNQYALLLLQNGNWISIARNMIYDPSIAQPILINMLHKYKIQSGFVVEHSVNTIQEFVNYTHDRFDRKTQYLVNFQGKTIFFALEEENGNNDIIVTLPGNSNCFRFVLHMETKTSEVESLFYDVYDKKVCCYGVETFGSTKVGKWMLLFIDRINECLQFKYCMLKDVPNLVKFYGEIAKNLTLIIPCNQLLCAKFQNSYVYSTTRFETEAQTRAKIFSKHEIKNKN